ncbi:MAG: F0F1 ATP synthase subunit [Myxococcales bacterium]|nr:F0F1 ATP synthase subunit [Myxococcales bacterium]
MDVGSVGLEMAAAIAIGYFGGGWLDGLLGTRPVLQWVGMAFGIVAAGMAIVRVSRRYLRDADRNDDGGKGDRNAGL